MFDRQALLEQLQRSGLEADPRQEKSFRLVRSLLEHVPAATSRENFAPGHLTASAWVLHPSEPRLLAIHHLRLDRWLPPGGHLDPGESPAATAAREAGEETGVRLVPTPEPPLVRVDVHGIPAAKGEPYHLHHDLGFAFLAADAGLRPQEDEVRAAEWIEPEVAARRDRAFARVRRWWPEVSERLRAHGR